MKTATSSKPHLRPEPPRTSPRLASLRTWSLQFRKRCGETFLSHGGQRTQSTVPRRPCRRTQGVDLLGGYAPVRTNSSQETAFGVKCALRGTSPFSPSPIGFLCKRNNMDLGARVRKLTL